MFYSLSLGLLSASLIFLPLSLFLCSFVPVFILHTFPGNSPWTWSSNGHPSSWVYETRGPAYHHLEKYLCLLVQIIEQFSFHRLSFKILSRTCKCNIASWNSVGFNRKISCSSEILAKGLTVTRLETASGGDLQPSPKAAVAQLPWQQGVEAVNFTERSWSPRLFVLFRWSSLPAWSHPLTSHTAAWVPLPGET